MSEVGPIVRVQAAMDKERQRIHEQCRYEIRMAKGNRETISEAYAKKRAALKALGEMPVIDRVWSTPASKNMEVNQGWSQSTASRHGRWTDQQEGQEWAEQERWQGIVLTPNRSTEKLTDETLKALADIPNPMLAAARARVAAAVAEDAGKAWLREEWEKRQGPKKIQRTFVLIRPEDVLKKWVP